MLTEAGGGGGLGGFCLYFSTGTGPYSAVPPSHSLWDVENELLTV